MKYTCIICGYKTLDGRYDWDICPICFWEDDVLYDGQDSDSPANGGLNISQAQANFMIFGACCLKDRGSVRAPTSQDEKDPDWQPLAEALRLLEEET
ncbi:MAG: hypothetical protein KDA65_00915 [Planctomycetaceae bacterium]|nr:hypothetical protein [Planctomycetaceae bacterium]